jgi:hypothetical protein
MTSITVNQNYGHNLIKNVEPIKHIKEKWGLFIDNLTTV